MINLVTTSDLVRVITGSALNLDVHASWVDLTSAGAVTPGRTNTLITTATTTTVVASPASSTYRNLKSLICHNRDASSSNAVSVVHSDGSNIPVLRKVTLLAGQSLCYDDGKGWSIR